MSFKSLIQEASVVLDMGLLIAIAVLLLESYQKLKNICYSLLYCIVTIARRDHTRVKVWDC